MNLICKHAPPIYGTPCRRCREEYGAARKLVNDRLKAISISGGDSIESISGRANNVLSGMLLPGGYSAQVYIEESKLSVRYFR